MTAHSLISARFITPDRAFPGMRPRPSNGCALAAQQANGHAQFDLATLYAKGEGAAQNLPSALVWYSAAAVLFEAMKPRPPPMLSPANRTGAMTPAQREEAKQIARAGKDGNYKRCN